MTSEQSAELNRRQNKTPFCTALHEAGHTMLADALNVSISRVEIELSSASGCAGGVTLVPNYPVAFAIVIALAGEAVDRSLGRTYDCDCNRLAYETDRDRVREGLLCLYPSGPTTVQGAHFWQNVPVLPFGSSS
jgi:hypothetical protein